MGALRKGAAAILKTSSCSLSRFTRSHETRARDDERAVSESWLLSLFFICSPADQPSVRTVLRSLAARMMMCFIGRAMADQQRSTRPTSPRCNVNTRIAERMSSAYSSLRRQCFLTPA